MGYLSKKDVSASVKARTITVGGRQYTTYEAYFGTDPYTRKPVRKSAKTEAQIRKRIDEFFRKLSCGGDAAVLLTAYESMDARMALDLIKTSGAKLSLVDCAKMALEASETGDDGRSTTIGEAYARYMDAQEGKSESHCKAVRSRVGAFVTLFGGERALSSVTAKEVSDNLESRLYVPSRPETKTTFNNHLNYIKTFFAWCSEPEQAYIQKSPLDGMKLKVKEWREPEYLSAESAERMFADLWAHRDESPADLADAVLSFFCGMRQEEIQRVRLGDSAVAINLEDRFIRVIKCKGSTKGVKPRCFTIPDTAYAWMTAFPFLDAVMLSNNQFRRHLNWCAERVGITIPRNAGRHTFITMYSAAYKNQVELTKIVGNSEDVRASNYDGVGNEREGLRFFSILPPAEPTPERGGSPA